MTPAWSESLTSKSVLWVIARAPLFDGPVEYARRVPTPILSPSTPEPAGRATACRHHGATGACHPGQTGRRRLKCMRTVVPVGVERTWTRSHNWLAIHSPRPSSTPTSGRIRPTSGSSMWPSSLTSETRASPRRPDAEHAVTTGVAHGVRSDFVHGDHQVRGLGAPEAAGARLRRETSDRTAGQRPGAEVEAEGGVGWFGQGGGEGIRPGRSSPRYSALGPPTPSRRTKGWLWRASSSDVWSSAAVSYGHSRVKSGAPGEGHVEQRLVTLALDELVRAPLGPDGLPDAAQGATPVLFHEIGPGRDDPGRVVADVVHVGEPHPVRVGSRAWP